MVPYDKNDTYVCKIEYYSHSERIIKLPVSLFGKKGRKGSIKREKKDRIDIEKLHSSISRSKRNIRRIGMSNDFEYFATWTINCEFADRFSVQDIQKKMTYLLNEYKKKNPDFYYIYVFEKHQDGALHMHGLVKGMSDLREYVESDFDSLPYYILDTIEKGRKIYYSEFFNNKLGYNTFTKIINYNACMNYIVKYISKNPVINENDQVYFCSKGLKKCVTEEFLKYIPEKYFEGGYEYTYDRVDKFTGEVRPFLLCKVKDIYPDNFNLTTKIDYIVSTTDKDNFI